MNSGRTPGRHSVENHSYRLLKAAATITDLLEDAPDPMRTGLLRMHWHKAWFLPYQWQSEVDRSLDQPYNSNQLNISTKQLAGLYYFCTSLYCTVLYRIVLLYSILLYYIALHFIVLLYCITSYCIMLCCIVLYFIVLHYLALYCFALYCTALCRIVLYYILLYYVMLYCIVF